MKNTIIRTFTIMLCFCHLTIYSQNISGVVTDKKSKKPIEYVMMQIKNKNIGAVTDSLGVFLLSNYTEDVLDSLIINILGTMTR